MAVKAQTVSIVTVPRQVASQLPAVGGLVLSKSGVPKRIASKRVLVGSGRVRIALQRVRKADIPEDATIPAWPLLTPGRPKAEPVPRASTPIESPSRRRKAERDRAVALLADDRNEGRTTPTVRRQNASAVDAEWRDPADVDTRRREPKVIKGQRARDVVHLLGELKSLNRKQMRAARRIRDQYDRGMEGVRIGYDRVQQTPVGFGPSDGPSGARLEALEEFERARSAVGVHMWRVLAFVVIENNTIEAYSKRDGCHAMTGKARLACALDRLAEHYEELDASVKRETAI